LRWDLLSVAGINVTYAVNVRITVSLDDRLVEKLRKIAVEQHITLSGMIREHLEKIAAEDAATSYCKRRVHVALERSFEKFRFPHRKREDLCERR
jgi:hypothetical protein